MRTPQTLYLCCAQLFLHAGQVLPQADHFLLHGQALPLLLLHGQRQVAQQAALGVQLLRDGGGEGGGGAGSRAGKKGCEGVQGLGQGGWVGGGSRVQGRGVKGEGFRAHGREEGVKGGGGQANQQPGLEPS